MDLIISQDFFPKIGGAHKWLYEVYKRWPSPVTALVQDYSCDSSYADLQVSFDSEDTGSLTIERYNLMIEDISFFNALFLKKTWAIKNKLKTFITGSSPTIHCVRAFPEAVPAVLLKKTTGKRIKIITYAHGEEILTAQTSRQLTFIAKWVYRHSDLVIANSQSTKRILESFSPESRIQIIHPGVDVLSFKIEDNAVKAFKSGFMLENDSIILCTMARMEPRKNHAKVIEAVANLRRQGFKISYLVASEGDEKDRLLGLVNDLDLNPFVKFTGYLTEEERILIFLISDIHVMPSIQVNPMIEGFGIVFLEAAAAGIPSISGNTGGQKEAVLDGETGLVVDGNNLDEITGAIRYLIKNESLRKKMGERGKEWAAVNDWEVIAKRTHEILSQIT